MRRQRTPAEQAAGWSETDPRLTIRRPRTELEVAAGMEEDDPALDVPDPVDDLEQAKARVAELQDSLELQTKYAHELSMQVADYSHKLLKAAKLLKSTMNGASKAERAEISEFFTREFSALEPSVLEAVDHPAKGPREPEASQDQPKDQTD